MHQAAQRNFDCSAEQLICKFHAIAMRDRMRRFIVSGTEQMEYVHEIDYLRGVSIIGVLLIHVVSEIIWTGRGTPANANYAMFWNQWSRFCVPIFIFMSGLLLTYRYELRGFQYYRYVKRRWVDLFVPYMFWTLLSILNLHKWGYINPGWIRDVVFTGRGYYFQLYFIPLIFQFHLLSPIWLYLSSNRRIRAFALLAVIFNVCYLGYYELIFLKILPESSFSRMIFTNIQGRFPAWIGYFALGCLVGKNLGAFREWVKRQSWWSLGAFYAISLGLLFWDYHYSVLVTKDLMNPGENFMRPVVFLYSVAAIPLFWKMASVHQARLLRSIGDLSFGIYFVHLTIRNLTKEVAESLLYSNWIGGTLAFVLVLALSYGFVWLLSRDEDGWVIVGKTSSGKRRLSATRPQ